VVQRLGHLLLHRRIPARQLDERFDAVRVHGPES
jgi:hypothetical protein